MNFIVWQLIGAASGLAVFFIVIAVRNHRRG